MKNNKTAKLVFGIGEALVAIQLLVLAWFWKTLPPTLPWFYSLPSGEQQLVGKPVLLIILGGAAVSLLITRIVAHWTSADDSPVEITIMTGGLIAIVLMTAGFFRVMQIIIGL